ncbi:hypothetical protein LIS04_111 [Listeria phage LIS04]|nr:hypothetical protein LIS04_111 [Listeria phage LIS04]
MTKPRITQHDVILEAEKILGRKMTSVEKEIATITVATSTALNALASRAQSAPRPIAQRTPTPSAGRSEVSTSEESAHIQKS